MTVQNNSIVSGEINGTGIGYDPTTNTITDPAQRVAVGEAVVKQNWALSGFKRLPNPSIDLHYSEKMGLYGGEAYTRTETMSYNDVAGVSQSAATNVAAFDRQIPSGLSPAAFLPIGLKTGGTGACYIPDIRGAIPSAQLSAGFTIVVDVDTPDALSNYGTILSLNSGTVANRVEISRNSSYQPQFIVQSGGVVVVNQAFGNSQNWYGGQHRLVISCAPNAFYFADNGRYWGSVTSGAVPTGLQRLDIGYSSVNTSYFGGWVRRVRIIPAALSLQDTILLSAGDYPTAAWGDSLTEGVGTSVGNTWPEVFRKLPFPRSGLYNGGIGGETSTQIRTRMVAATQLTSYNHVIWVGRNNYAAADTVMADIAAMVATIPHNRYVVMTVTNGTAEPAGSDAYNAIVALNARILATYPNNSLDIRSLIVAASGGTNDQPNPSWMSDAIHFTATGYAYIAQQVKAFMVTKNWIPAY